MGGTIIPGITSHEKRERERERMRVRHEIVWFHLSCNNPQRKASGEHVLFKRYEQIRQFSCATVNMAQREKEREGV